MTSSPTSPIDARLALFVDHRQIPAVQRQPDAHRALAVQPRRARHHRGLGRAVGVPHLAAVDGESFGQLRRAGLAAEDQQPHRLERLGGPQRGQRRHRRDDGDVAGHQPRAEVHAAAHQRARRGHQAGAVPPGQPHLLAGRVERHRQSGEHPVAGPDRVVLQEHPRLGVDERGGAAVADRDALRGAGGSGGEDDPRVVATQRRPRAPSPRRAGPADQALLGDDRDHLGLAEHQLGPLVGVVGVDRHVGGAGGERRQDRHVRASSCPTASGCRCGRRGRCRGRRATRRSPRCRRPARRR